MKTWKNGGGLVSTNAKVEDTVFVQRGSYITGNATVKGDSVVTENSYVKDSSKVVDSMVCHSTVKGKAQVVGSILREDAVIDEIASILNSEIVGTNVKRFSKVVSSVLKGGWCQGDVYNSELENCKVLGKIVKNKDA